MASALAAAKRDLMGGATFLDDLLPKVIGRKKIVIAGRDFRGPRGHKRFKKTMKEAEAQAARER